MAKFLWLGNTLRMRWHSKTTKQNDHCQCIQKKKMIEMFIIYVVHKVVYTGGFNERTQVLQIVVNK